MVELDLQKLGYTVISVSTTMPNTSVDDHTKLICVRRDDDGIPEYENRSVETEEDRWHDYNFMKLGEDGYWYHKPGMSNPLKYNHVPTYNRIWFLETAIGNPFSYKRSTTFTFDSEIWFIEYTTPHVWEYAFWESGQHVMHCTICDEEKLGDCQWTSPSYVGLNSHQFTCELCGGLGGNAACTQGYTNYYHPELAIVHQTVCTVCMRAYSDPESCTYLVTDNGDNTHTLTCTVCDDSYVSDCNYQCNYTGSGTTHTHTTTCSGCDHSETESCTFVIQYNGQVDGNNTHISACSVCGYSVFGVTQCMYNSNNLCRFCGVHKDYVPINGVKEEILDA